VVEVRTPDLDVTLVLASPEACAAAVTAVPGVRVGAVAADEMLLIGEIDLAILEAAVGPVDGDGLVIDVSDGWMAWELHGADAPDVFARLSELALLDAAFLQGEVARLPVKVFVEPELITLLVPAMWGDHLGARIRSDCTAAGIGIVSP
jgi:hypothetical protein